MIYIILALFLFMASVFAHILYCRKTAKPGLHAKNFIVTVLIFLCIYAELVSALPVLVLVNPYSLWGMPFKITAAIIFIVSVPIYLSFYVLTQLTSPSKKILSVIAQQGELTYSEILAAVQKEDFIALRLSDLYTSGCIKHADGKYILTSEGHKIAAILDCMQFVLGRKVGG